ncbi:spore germination protein KB [Paenibacillus phyllosphaerae]|uniref:Spore germination protein KB n=1 Tax=Paenibacillus phyllosphaerae TaxID=274593 RepID=A0A7W5FPV0_9BACL|nr:GerAB/ArcD/ProY family transporter [Paenibacillus phyllosphaerae]MBB3112796.1 spore germination protein KB [Paenibacillus phyllosphaerae]
MSKSSAISPTQLFAMIILFEFGTALVLPIGLTSAQNSWLSILLAMPAGMIFYWLLMYLHRRYPALILSAYIRQIVGPYIGLPIGLMYGIYFMYISARNLREAGDLLITTSYDQTPIVIVHAAMIATVIYIVHKGVQVLFRLGEIYIIFIIALGLLSDMAVLLSGTIEIRDLLPIWGEGVGPTLRSAYPNIFLFPFAEVITFATVLPHLKQNQAAGKIGMLAILASSVMLSMTHAIEVSVIGKDMYSRSTFPLFTAITTVEVAEFVERLDALVILALIIGVFFKMTMYAYAATSIVADVFRIKEMKQMAYPIGSTIFLVSIMSAWSFPEHGAEGTKSFTTIQPIFLIYIPVLLFVVQLVRQKFSRPSS